MSAKPLRRSASRDDRRRIEATAPRSSRRRFQIALVGIALVVLVVAVFGRTLDDRFIAFDDPYYVTENAVVQRGVSADGLRWALTTSDYFYWHPVTWLSHMIDCEIYGLDPRGHHATNVMIHGATTLVVFTGFLFMTGALWRSAGVAALFAAHPLQVESVAWISERKELLAGFFWFASILAYARYARRPSPSRYGLVAVGLSLGLMSKPVLVTLPLALLLIDFWPLGRFSTVSPIRLFLEKVPLLVLAAASSVITYAGQRQAGAMQSLSGVALAVRLRNAVVSYATYVVKMLWPHPLAVLYPYRTSFPPAILLSCVFLVCAIVALAVAFRRRAPFLLSGWFWFLGVLVPTIGVIQVGSQSHADRFTYIPSVGLFVMAVWGAGFLVERRPRAASTAAVLAGASILALALAASAQAGYWKDSVTLMRHTVDVTADNAGAMHLLAVSLAAEGRLDDAIPYYRESLRLKPQNPLGYYSLGLALSARQQLREAALCFAEAARLHPAYTEAHFSLGDVLLRLNRAADAREELETALRLPMTAAYSAQAHFRLGVIAGGEGDMAKAQDEFAAALRFQPDFPEARANLAIAESRIRHR